MPASEDSSDRLARAFRARKAASERAVWRAALERICGLTIQDADFLSTPETEDLIRKFIEAYHRSTFQLNAEGHELESIQRRLADWLSRFSGARLVFLEREASLPGAIRVPVDPLVRCAPELIQAMHTDLTLVTPDVSSGICLEWNYYDSEDRYHEHGLWQLTMWGEFV